MEKIKKFIEKKLCSLKDEENVLKELYRHNSRYYADIERCRTKAYVYRLILDEIEAIENEWRS